MLHNTQMFFAMILAGLFSTMNIWANSPQDIYLTLNDLYMSLLMIAWMYVFLGIFQKNIPFLLYGGLGVICFFFLIRRQVGITPRQYVQGMITHHSMAVFMSQHLLQKNPPLELKNLAQRIVISQEKEIQEMKKMI